MTRLLAVYDGSDSLLMRFGYADSRMPVAMTAGGATYYLGYDQVGTLKAVADASGNVVRKIVYDSFGNVISDSDPAFHVPFGFAGGLHYRDTGLVRFGYRDYDPDTGRWTAKDPIGFLSGDTDLYGYCVGDPVNLTDPLGLIRDEWKPDTSHTYTYRGTEYHIEVDENGNIHAHCKGKKIPELNLPEVPLPEVYNVEDFPLKKPPIIRTDEVEDFQKRWEKYIEDLENLCP